MGKKPYSKPMIIFESFTLTTSLSSSCEVKAISQQYVCGTENNLFSTGLVGCLPPYVNSWQEGGIWNGKKYPCYTMASESYNVFNS